jgi:hypothetical protein
MNVCSACLLSKANLSIRAFNAEIAQIPEAALESSKTIS